MRNQIFNETWNQYPPHGACNNESGSPWTSNAWFALFPSFLPFLLGLDLDFENSKGLQQSKEPLNFLQ